MAFLKKDWLIEGLIDFEYKKYVLLGYLKQIKEHFNVNRLYPFLSDLLFHYQNLVSIKQNKKLIYEVFPQRVSKADFKKLEIIYKKIAEDDDIMKELEEIINYAMPKFKDFLEEGKDIYEYVEKNLEIQPIGLSPLYQQEGYMLVNRFSEKRTKVYRYQISIFENANEKFRALNTTYLESHKNDLGMSFENLKVKLVNKYKNLPNPATYLITEKMGFPFEETTLPIAKRLLVRYVSNTDNSK